MIVTTDVDTAWRVACNGRVNPWFVTRYNGMRAEYLMNAKDTHVRRFKTREAAQKVADKMQVKADFDDSREHMRLAVHHMLRATDGLQPTKSSIRLTSNIPANRRFVPSSLAASTAGRWWPSARTSGRPSSLTPSGSASSVPNGCGVTLGGSDEVL